jgi:hypothetical protein
MNINQVAKIVTLKEGLKKQVSIAQVREILRVINTITGGELYRLLRRV